MSMKSLRKYIVELDGRCVYASKNYDRVRDIAWKLIRLNPKKEVIVHIDGIICGI